MNPTEPMSSKTPEDNSSQPDPLGNAREPLLSDEEATSLRSDIDSVALRVRDWYEEKITSGELRVVKKATIKLTDNGEHGHCSICGKLVWNTWMLKADNFCPKCGSEIHPL